MRLRNAAFPIAALAVTAGAGVAALVVPPKPTPRSGPSIVQTATSPAAAPVSGGIAAAPIEGVKRSASRRETAAPAPPAAPHETASLVRAVRDAESGELRAPRPGELAPQGVALGVDARPSQLPEEVLEDGTILVNLDDRFLEFVTARRESDGTIRFSCGPTHAAAPAPAAPTAPAKAPAWEEK